MSGFPSDGLVPNISTHTIGSITWLWNGDAWQIQTSSIGGVTGPAGQTGNTGNTGVGISGASLSNYELILTLTNGTTLNVGYIRGETGPTGADGTGEGASGGVATLNGLSGAVNLLAGTGITLNVGPAGITITSTITGGIGSTGPTGATGGTGNPSGLYRRYINSAADVIGITVGEIRVASQTTSYTFYIAQNSHVNISEKAFIDTWNDSTNAVKSTIAVKNRSGSVYGMGTLNTITELADAGVTYYSLILNRLTPGVTFSVLEDLFIDVMIHGDRGSTGSTGNQGPIGKVSGIPYSFDTLTTDPQTSPFGVNGYLRYNNISGPTYIYLTDFSNANVGVSAYVNTFDDSTTNHKGYLHISGTASNRLWIFNVTGITWFDGGDDGDFPLTEYPDYFRLDVTPSYTGGTFSDNQEVYVSFVRTGDKGASGSDGAPGSGGGAAGTKTYAIFTPLNNEPPASNFATIDTVNSISVLDFDGTTQESAIFRSMIPEGASFSNLLTTLYFTASTVTGGVVWGVQWEKLTGGGITGDRFTGGATGLATLSGATATPVGLTLLSTSFDGLTVGDPYRVKIYRDAANAADGMGGDAELLIVEIRGA